MINVILIQADIFGLIRGSHSNPMLFNHFLTAKRRHRPRAHGGISAEQKNVFSLCQRRENMFFCSADAAAAAAGTVVVVLVTKMPA